MSFPTIPPGMGWPFVDADTGEFQSTTVKGWMDSRYARAILRKRLDLWDEFRVDGTGGASWPASTYSAWIAGIDDRLDGAAEKASIGNGFSGDEIWCYTAGTEGQPHALLVSGTHGSETLSQHAAMRFFTEFATSDDVAMAELRSRLRLSWIPTLTPDSYMVSVNNGNGVNVNRNFPFYWDFYTPGLPKGASALSEPESQALKGLLDDTDIACVADCHMLSTTGTFLMWQGPSSWTAGNRELGYGSAALFNSIYNSESPVTFAEFGTAALGDPMISNWAEHYMRHNLGRANASSMLFEARTDLKGSSSLVYSSREGIRLYCGMIQLYLVEWLESGQRDVAATPRSLHAYRTNRQPTVSILSQGTLIDTTNMTPVNFDNYPGSASSTDFRDYMDIPVPAPGEIEVFGHCYYEQPSTGTPGEQEVQLGIGIAATPTAGGDITPVTYASVVDTIPAGLSKHITVTTQARLAVTSVDGGALIRVQLFTRMFASAATPAKIMFAGVRIRYTPNFRSALAPSVKLSS